MTHTSGGTATITTLEPGLTGVLKLVVAYTDEVHPELPCIACLAHALWKMAWRDASALLTTEASTAGNLIDYAMSEHQDTRIPSAGNVQPFAGHPLSRDGNLD